jgi:tRNA/tmRNA/rRNA uracil-C5-methylase (TrmA/RlmC/RlmD family)
MRSEPLIPAETPEPAATPPLTDGRAVPWVVGRAVTRVDHLNARGEAVGVVERWLTQPSEADWVLVHGPRAPEAPLPSECAFVGGLPGETVEVDVIWPTPRPGRPRARRTPEPRIRVRAVSAPAPERVPARCLVFGECGGCQLQHLAYDQQLAWKTARVAGLARQAGLEDVAVAPAIGCDDPWNYRNHMRFSVDRDGRPGLTARGSHRVLPLRACPIAHPLINAALDILADAPLARPQLLLRCGTATGQVLAQPTPAPELAARLRDAGLDLRTQDLAEELAIPHEQPPEAASPPGIHASSTVSRPFTTAEAGQTPLSPRGVGAPLSPRGVGASGGRLEAPEARIQTPLSRRDGEGVGVPHWGLGGGGSSRRARFSIRPSSFFQTNTAQANRMAELVLAGLPTGPDVTLVDAYCGVGTFAALMAPRVGRVLAIEESASAVRDARVNLDAYPNVAIVQGKAEVVLPTLTERLDGLVIDPPRAGCGRPVLDALVARRVPRVVYVSCDPTTLVRDLAYLCRETGAYRVVGLQPLDMFPQTAHIETIATLEVAP